MKMPVEPKPLIIKPQRRNSKKPKEKRFPMENLYIPILEKNKYDSIQADMKKIKN